MAQSYRRSVVASTFLGALGLAGCYSIPPETEAELVRLRQENQAQQAARSAERSQSQTALQERDAIIASLRSSTGVLEGRLANAEGYHYLDALLREVQEAPQGASDAEKARRLAYFPSFQTAVSRYRELDQSIAAIGSAQLELNRKKAMDLTGYFQPAAGDLAQDFPRAWTAQSKRYEELLIVGRALHGAYGRAIAVLRDYIRVSEIDFEDFNQSTDAQDMIFLERIAHAYVPDSARHLSVGQRMDGLESVLHAPGLVAEWDNDDNLLSIGLQVQRISGGSPYETDGSWATMCADTDCVDLLNPTGGILRWVPAGQDGRRASAHLGTVSEIDAVFR